MEHVGPSLGWAWPLKCAHACLIVMTRTTREPHACNAQHHVLHTERFIVPPRRGGIERYRDPSVCLSHGAAALGYRHAGCLQLSHRRPAEMCGLPESSAGGRRSAASRTGGGHIVSPPPPPGRLLAVFYMPTTLYYYLHLVRACNI